MRRYAQLKLKLTLIGLKLIQHQYLPLQLTPNASERG